MKSLYRHFGWKPNHGSEQPCRMVFYDTETFATEHPSIKGVQNHTLRIGVATAYRRIDGRWQRKQSTVFFTPVQFWQFLYGQCKRREPLTVYAHNAAFDFTVARGWDELREGRMRTSEPGRSYIPHGKTVPVLSRPYRGFAAIDGIPWIMETRCDRGSIRLLDSLNYLPTSLAKLGEWIGISKLKSPDNDSTGDYCYLACRNHVDILAAAMIWLMDYWAARKLGTWQTTLGRLAYSSFRHTTPDSGIVSHGDDPYSEDATETANWRRMSSRLDAQEVSEVERRAYYGGRTLVNYCGDVRPDAAVLWFTDSNAKREQRPYIPGPCTILDVNGLYPYVMSQYSFPTSLLNTIRRPSQKDAEQLITAFPCVADVTIETSTRQYPIRIDKRLMWASGKFTTALCGEELRRAVEYCDVVNVSNLCVYQAGRPFGDFVRYWDTVKVDALKLGDNLLAMLAKGIQNSLFGKLGQRRPTWEMAPNVAPLRPWGGFIRWDDTAKRFRKYRSIARIVQAEGEKRDCGHTMTACSAAITAAARCYMDDLRALCPERSILYQDTDSLFCLPGALDALTRSGYVEQYISGLLKTQGEYHSLSIYGPKTYRKGDSIVAAGLGSNAVPAGTAGLRYTAFERSGSVIAREADGCIRAWQVMYTLPQAAVGVQTDADGWSIPIHLCGAVSEQHSLAELDSVADCYVG